MKYLTKKRLGRFYWELNIMTGFIPLKVAVEAEAFGYEFGEVRMLDD